MTPNQRARYDKAVLMEYHTLEEARPCRSTGCGRRAYNTCDEWDGAVHCYECCRDRLLRESRAMLVDLVTELDAENSRLVGEVATVKQDLREELAALREQLPPHERKKS